MEVRWIVRTLEGEVGKRRVSRRIPITSGERGTCHHRHDEWLTGRQVPATLAEAVWPIRLQQSSGALTPAH